MHAVELDEGESIPDLDGFDVLLVMGGPQDVWQTAQFPWLLDEMKAVTAWVRAGHVPGASAFGARAGRRGWADGRARGGDQPGAG